MLNFLTLPAELILTILHYFDLNDLNRLARTNKALRGLTQDPALWKGLLDKYFPYLRENNPEITDFKALFIEEYNRFKKKYDNFVYCENYKTLTTKIPMHEVLAALDGKPNLHHRMRIPLLALAEANGKNKLKISLRTLTNAMMIAAESGNTASVSRLLEHHGNALSGTCLEEAHISAAFYGHVSVVKILEKKTTIPPSKIAVAIIQACKINHSDIMEHYQEWLLNKNGTFNRIFSELNQDDFLILLGCLIKVGKNEQAKAVYDVAKKLTRKKRTEWRAPIQEMTLAVSIQYGNRDMLYYFIDNTVTNDPFPFDLLPGCMHQDIIIAMMEKFKSTIPPDIKLALYKNHPSLFLKEIEQLLQSNTVIKWTARQHFVAFYEACRQNAVQLIEQMAQKRFKHFYYYFVFSSLFHLIRFGHEKISIHLLSTYSTKIPTLHLQRIINAAILHRRFEVIEGCIKLFKARIPSTTIEMLFKLAKEPSYSPLQNILKKYNSASITLKGDLNLKTNPNTNAFNRRLKEAILCLPKQKKNILQAWHHARVNCAWPHLGKCDTAKPGKLRR